MYPGVEKLYRKQLSEQYAKEKEESTVDQLTRMKLSSEGDADAEVEDDNATAVDPCWLLEILPDDILIEIITILAYIDPRAHVSFSTTCQRISRVSFDPTIYKHLCKQIYPHQVYSQVTRDLNNISDDQEEMVKSWDFNWKEMLHDRPFVKYHGVYISKVSYISEGEREYTFYAPVKLVTYFRYLRFYPDGTAFKLTTTDEPAIIVPIFHKENHESIKNSLLTKWHIEMDGQVIMTRKTSDFEFVEELKVVHLGDRKYHRLLWVNSGTIDKDGERSYFNMKKEKPFNFSGVKRYEVHYGRTDA